MEKILLVLALLYGTSSAYVAPLRMTDHPIPNQYIVVLKPIANVTVIKDFVDHLPGAEVRQEYQHVIKGLGVHLASPSTLNLIRENINVSWVEEDANVTLQDASLTWGLDRVDQRNLPLDGQATFTGNGSGVNVYIIDTGIYPDNTYFGGRARVAYDATRPSQRVPWGVDCHGHGTHCAGTVGANNYGVARGANLWGVKVLGCFGWGSWTTIIKGMDWVAANGVPPAVASISLGGSTSEAVDLAVKGLYDAGVTVSVAAGNSNNDACLYSPAGAPLAITVGATDNTDHRAYFSCYGSCVDIFAPGVDVLSTVIGSPTATAIYSGTSMACPHVSGAAAIAIGNAHANGQTLTPKEVWDKLKDDSTSGVLQNKGLLSPDRMLYIP